jgi:hypothetical protein
VDVSLLTRTLDLDFNGVTAVVDVSLLSRVYPLIFHHTPPPSFAAEVVDVYINSILTLRFIPLFSAIHLRAPLSSAEVFEKRMSNSMVYKETSATPVKPSKSTSNIQVEKGMSNGMVHEEALATQFKPLKSTSNILVCTAQVNVRDVCPAQNVYVEVESGK